MADGIYEITKKMNNNMQNDLSEITSIVSNYFQKKYFDKIQNNFTDYKTKLSENPPREIQLLNAMRAFAPENKKTGIDNAINALNLLNTFNVIANDFNNKKIAAERKLSSQSTDSSVKPDGVYDIDENCINKNSPSQLSIKELLFVLFAAGAL